MGDRRHNRDANPPRTYEFKLGDELRGERATLGKSLLDVQRDLRIKAAYIAAIENCEPDVFPNPGFIAGYIRSYARYMNLDPDEVYQRFCQESGFTGPAGANSGRRDARFGAAAAPPRAPGAGSFSPDFPLARPPSFSLADVPFSAIGSILVLIGLIGGLGYGGWTVLQNIQRVKFAPVDEVPVAVAELEELAPPAPEEGADPILPELATPVAAKALVELYRQQELEVPILVPRDGPIASLDPDLIGPMAGRGRVAPPEAYPTVYGPPMPTAIAEPADESAPGDAPAPQVMAAARPVLTVVAERAAWVRVYLEDGTVVFERILESGETYSPPTDLGVPLLWAGNSGSVFVRVGETLHGPVGSGTRAVRDVPLDPAKIVESYAAVSQVPDAISQALAETAHAAGAAAMQ
jgi:cytoskeleton protein RodZ